MDDTVNDKAAKNDAINAKSSDQFNLYTNIWMTLLAPILVGVFISYWFSLEQKSDISIFSIMCICVFIVVHFCLAKNQIYSQKKHITHSEVQQHTVQYNNLVGNYNKLREVHSTYTNLAISQMTTLYLISAELDKAVGDLNNELAREIDNDPDNPPIPLFDSITALADSHLHNILWPLVVNKEEIFSYKEKSYYNIALYVYNAKSGKLEVKKRFHDQRIRAQNRDWRPGIGHVGMTFLHKEIKCCPSIKNSTELTTKTEHDSKYYNSFFSVPILACEDNEQTENDPHGVLVLTSASENQFNPRRDQIFLQAISKMLAVYLDKQEHAQKMAKIIESKVDNKQF